MCDPVSAAVVAGVMTVASTAASVVAQSKAADAQAKAINSQLQATEDENRQAASAELFDQMRATRREQARIRAASGEAGLDIGSASIENLLADSAMQGSLQGSRTLANLESRDRAAEEEAKSQMSRVQKPTALGAGLQIGTAAANAWSGVEHAKLEVKREKAAAAG